MHMHEFVSDTECASLRSWYWHNNTYVSMCSRVVLQDSVVPYPRSAARSGPRKEGTLPHDTRGCTETHTGQHPSGWEQ